jgi:hypothetical protein
MAQRQPKVRVLDYHNLHPQIGILMRVEAPLQLPLEVVVEEVPTLKQDLQAQQLVAVREVEEEG